MPNPYFQFKQFTVFHDKSAMKVTTDSCLFGAWCADLYALQSASSIMHKDNQQLLDIGTGTGLLSLMMAQKNNILIDAVEIVQATAVQAGENFSASPWSDRLHIIQTDIIDFAPDYKYDVILSNPPFYEQELTSGKLAKDIAHHSVHLTLKQLILSIKNNLDSNGCFFLLLPYKRMLEAERLLEESQLHVNNKTVVHQSVKHPPFRVMFMGSNNCNGYSTSSLPIKNEDGSYSTYFTNLLKDYYLKL